MGKHVAIIVFILSWASIAHTSQKDTDAPTQPDYPMWELEGALGVAHFTGGGASSTRAMPTMLLSGGLRLAKHFSVHAQVLLHLILTRTIDEVDGIGFGSSFFLAGYWHILGSKRRAQPYLALAVGWGQRIKHLETGDSHVDSLSRGFNFGLHIGVPFTINEDWAVGPVISAIPHLPLETCVEVDGDVTSCSGASSFNQAILGFAVSVRYLF